MSCNKPKTCCLDSLGAKGGEGTLPRRGLGSKLAKQVPKRACGASQQGIRSSAVGYNTQCVMAKLERKGAECGFGGRRAGALLRHCVGSGRRLAPGRASSSAVACVVWIAGFLQRANDSCTRQGPKVE